MSNDSYIPPPIIPRDCYWSWHYYERDSDPRFLSDIEKRMAGCPDAPREVGPVRMLGKLIEPWPEPKKDNNSTK